ncbi:GDSL-type esterase/lipase family protein [Paenibacillus sp. J5C_2022]|uniref:SGNH/GDSL hydrolase family protein n=1 Tax=Paenibacillus sp. J5C2022 TaxID=2977129 RepID=UPI0021D2A4A2|nr:GDSL-type esterase/lipase family protein [Paenibacillus sp. J5C2022]MCU6708121.1 GDSL-type esterase/lipase family protein [Paenibacillus sp. J5C2022]
MHSFNRLRERLAERAGDVRARAVTYVAIGDSVTQGCMEAGVVEYKNVYHQVLRRAMERRYPETVVNVINSGVSGDAAEASRPRWERDVLMYKPDLVTICFGHNDAHGGREGIVPFVQALSDLLDRLAAETEAEVLLMTPCMMMTKDNERIAQVHKEMIPSFLKLAEEGTLKLYVEAVRELARKRDIPLLDMYGLWEQMLQEGTDIHEFLSNGINHPNPEFHKRWGTVLEQKLLVPELAN